MKREINNEIIIITGNIGAGKSTLFNKIKQFFLGETGIHYLEEPIDNPIALSLLKDAYEKKNSTSFLRVQNWFLNVGGFQLTSSIQTCQKNYSDNVIVCDSSILFSESFLSTAYQNGMVEEMVKNEFLETCNEVCRNVNYQGFNVTIVHVNTPWMECRDNIKKRGRVNESNEISDQYLMDLDSNLKSTLYSLSNKKRDEFFQGAKYLTVKSLSFDESLRYIGEFANRFHDSLMMTSSSLRSSPLSCIDEILSADENDQQFQIHRSNTQPNLKKRQLQIHSDESLAFFEKKITSSRGSYDNDIESTTLFQDPKSIMGVNFENWEHHYKNLSSKNNNNNNNNNDSSDFFTNINDINDNSNFMNDYVGHSCSKL
eukprot:gene3551-4425_t